jgi:hypothetical protein
MWAFIAGVFVTIFLGALTNELGEIAPWLARRMLKRAARIEARNQQEPEAIYQEYLLLLEKIPGKLLKLGFAVGRLCSSIQHLRREIARHKKSTRPYGCKRKRGLTPIPRSSPVDIKLAVVDFIYRVVDYPVSSLEGFIISISIVLSCPASVVLGPIFADPFTSMHLWFIVIHSLASILISCRVIVEIRALNQQEEQDGAKSSLDANW